MEKREELLNAPMGKLFIKMAIPGMIGMLVIGVYNLVDGIFVGQFVVDYGCGPARFIKDSSLKVGKNRKVFAIDIHPLAVKKVNEKIQKFNLDNVEAMLIDEYKTSIKDASIDVVYALDMFHMIKKPVEFLSELYMILKLNGTVILEYGHQSRTSTKEKIKKFGLFKILKETKSNVRCRKY